MNKVLARGIMTIAAVNDGKNGQTPHLHIAYANSPDGKVDFSTDDSKGRAYIGQYVSYTDEPDSTDAGMYTWSRFKGNDAVMYKLVMSGSQFNVKADGRLSPEFISIYAYKVQGENLTQLSPSNNVKVLVTKGESKVPLLNDNKESLAVRSDRWNLWADKDNMPDVFNVELFIKDKLVDKQKLVDMQKIHVVRDGRNGQDAKVWHVAFSIRNITGKKGETFKLKYGRTVGESTSWYDDSPTNHGFNQLYAVIIDDATGNKHQADLGADLNVADFFTGGSMTVRLMNRKTGETLAQDTIYAEAKDGKPGKDAVSYKLIPMSENVVAYFPKEDEKNTENTGKKKEKEKKIDIRLLYKIMKSAGEQVTFTKLKAEGMTLTIQPSVNKSETFNYDYKIDAYRLLDSIVYKEIPGNSYTVTLKKGNDIVDQRIVPITLKPSVAFDIDTVNGEIRSEIKTVDGNVNSFKATINETSNTVGNLEKEFTQLQLTSKEISLTVNNGTRPNLLWGSDLDLSEVQDKIQLAYHNGDVIKQNTAKKEELQRQLDATPTNDTAKRNDLQKKINACNDNITAAKNKVNECKAAIEKHLGVGMGEIKVDDAEYFQYLKGDGVAGSDAVMFKSKDGVARWTFFRWEKIKVKPNTVYTMSAWVKFKQNKANVNQFYVGVNETESSQDLAFKEGSDVRYYLAEIKDWERRHWTFTTKEERLITVLFAHSGTDESLMWLCRPKLEEGNTATPWCAYDGTEAALLATGLDIKNRKMMFTTDNFIIRNNNGETTVTVDRNGMFQLYGKDKIYPGIRFGVNEVGEMVLEFWRGNKKMYDLGPDNVFDKLDRVESYFEEADLRHVVVYTSYGEKFIRRDIGENVYILREGYKMIGNVRQYDVSGGQHPSAYDGKIFTKTVSPINSFTMVNLPTVTGKYVHLFDAMAIDDMEKASKGGQITEQRNIQVISVQDGVALPRNAVIEGDGGMVKIHFDSYKIPDEL